MTQAKRGLLADDTILGVAEEHSIEAGLRNGPSVIGIVGDRRLGLGLTALILAGYVWAGAAFPLWLAAVSGGGFILCGLWMRRA